MHVMPSMWGDHKELKVGNSVATTSEQRKTSAKNRTCATGNLISDKMVVYTRNIYTCIGKVLKKYINILKF